MIKKNMTIKISPELKESAEIIARQEGFTLSGLITFLLTQKVNEMKQDNRLGT